MALAAESYDPGARWLRTEGIRTFGKEQKCPNCMNDLKVSQKFLQ